MYNIYIYNIYIYINIIYICIYICEGIGVSLDDVAWNLKRWFPIGYQYAGIFTLYLLCNVLLKGYCKRYNVKYQVLELTTWVFLCVGTFFVL